MIDGASITVAQAMGRPPVTLETIGAAGFTLETMAGEEHIDESTFVAGLKYQGYLKRHTEQWARTKTQERRAIPASFAYGGIPGLSREVVERLSAVRPDTLGQAARVPGVTPAAVAILASRLARA